MLTVGETVGAYKIEDVIGKGGMASVYRAYHTATDRHVAVKVMLPEIAADDTFRARFEREAKVLAGLQHIHILSVFDYGEQDDNAYLVMPLLPGKTLHERIQSTPLSLDEVKRIFRQLASALDYAHAQGVLHRDIKPINIMLDASGNALLADFGLTRLMTSSHTNRITTDSMVIGTPAYMSPEQGQGMPLDSRSDLYSLAVVLFEMLTGDVPFTAETPVAVIFKHISDPVPSIRDYRPDLPIEVDAVLARALSKTQTDRYDTALEIADDFEAALAGTMAAAPDTVQLAASAVSAPPPTTKEAAAAPPPVQTPAPIVADDTVGTLIGESPSVELAEKPKLKGEPPRKRWLWVGGGLTVTLLASWGVLLTMGFGSSTLLYAPAFMLPAHEGRITSMTTAGDTLLTGGQDSNVMVWSIDALTNGDLTAENPIQGHSGAVTTLDIHPDGAEYLTGGTDGTEYHWDAETYDLLLTNLNGATVRVSSFSPDGRMWASMTSSEVSVIGMNNGATLVDLPAYVSSPNDQSELHALTFNSIVTPVDEDIFEYQLASGDDAGYIQVWTITYDGTIDADAELARLSTGEITMDEMPKRLAIELYDNVEIGTSRVTQVVYNTEATQLAASTLAGLVRVLESDTLEQVRILPETYGEVYDIAFSPDGAYLATATEVQDLVVWDLERGEAAYLLDTPAEEVERVLFTDNGWLLAGGDNGAIYGWNFEGELVE